MAAPPPSPAGNGDGGHEHDALTCSLSVAVRVHGYGSAGGGGSKEWRRHPYHPCCTEPGAACGALHLHEPGGAERLGGRGSRCGRSGRRNARTASACVIPSGFFVKQVEEVPARLLLRALLASRPRGHGGRARRPPRSTACRSASAARCRSTAPRVSADTRSTSTAGGAMPRGLARRTSSEWALTCAGH